MSDESMAKDLGIEPDKWLEIKDFFDELQCVPGEARDSIQLLRELVNGAHAAGGSVDLTDAQQASMAFLNLEGALIDGTEELQELLKSFLDPGEIGMQFVDVNATTTFVILREDAAESGGTNTN